MRHDSTLAGLMFVVMYLYLPMAWFAMQMNLIWAFRPPSTFPNGYDLTQARVNSTDIQTHRLVHAHRFTAK